MSGESLRTSVLTSSGAAAITHSANSVRYSVGLIPGQRTPGSRASHPAPPVISTSGSPHAYGRLWLATVPSTSMIAEVEPPLPSSQTSW